VVAIAVRALALVLAVLVGVGAVSVKRAYAAPAPATSEILRAGNTAATGGDWERVEQLVEPLLPQSLAPADRAEAHRLAGLAAFFRKRSREAEKHFLAYLRLDLEGRLDPALYPPDVIAFFNDVTSRHGAELRALRRRSQRTWMLTLLPPFGQLQNGHRTKALVLGAGLGALLVTNLTTYYYLRAWCDHTDGGSGGGLTCNDGEDRTSAATRLRPYNIASGIGFLLLYAYGVYDGVQGYRQRSRERIVQPFVGISAESRIFGLSGRF
jgi:hypothetical protein